MGNAGHQLADPQQLFLLAEFGVGAVHVAADGRGEVDRDPQRAAEGREHGERVQPVERPRGGRLARKMEREAGNQRQIFQEHDAADERRGHRRRRIGQIAAEVHPGDYHVKNEIGEERVPRQVGEIQEHGQGDQIEDDLQEDDPFDALPARRPVVLAEFEQQVVDQHDCADREQGPGPRQHAHRPGDGGHGEDRRAGPETERNEPASALGRKSHGRSPTTQLSSFCRGS